MKNVFLPAVIFLCVIFSCKEEDRPEMTAIGEWELVKSVGTFEGEGAVQEGDELEWMETYIFRTDNTFTKRREAGQNNYLAEGKYILKAPELTDSSNARYYLELQFESGDEIIIGDCYAGALTEFLIINHQGQLVNTWGSCDGPTLFYDKK